MYKQAAIKGSRACAKKKSFVRERPKKNTPLPKTSILTKSTNRN